MPPFALIPLLGLATAITCGVPDNDTKSGVITYEPNCAYVAPLRTAAERRNDAMYHEVRRVAGAIKLAYNRHDVHAAAAYDACSNLPAGSTGQCWRAASNGRAPLAW